MTIHTILKMGDPRLLRQAQPVPRFDTPELHALVRDMKETMAQVNGAGLAAPQIGVDLQVVIFGSGALNPRYPQAPVVPPTVLINPTLTPLSDEMEEGWEGCLSVPGLRGVVAATRGNHGQSVTFAARRHGLLTRPVLDTIVFMPPLCTTDAELEFGINAIRQSIKEVLGRTLIK